jgi:hypothetical protein
MKKFFAGFFIVLGVIFFIILLILAYLFIFDPYNIKPFIFNDQTSVSKLALSESQSANSDSTAKETENTDSVTEEVDKAPNLSPAQEKALETVGIDPAAVPQSFTPEQLTCFEAVLGKARVDEIKAGDTPSATEFFKAKSCI